MRRAQAYLDALEKFEAAVRPMLGTMNFYFGPGARTAVSTDSIRAYREIADACAETWRLLSPDGIVCTCSLHTYDPEVEHLDYCARNPRSQIALTSHQLVELAQFRDGEPHRFSKKPNTNLIRRNMLTLEPGRQGLYRLTEYGRSALRARGVIV